MHDLVEGSNARGLSIIRFTSKLSTPFTGIDVNQGMHHEVVGIQIENVLQPMTCFFTPRGAHSGVTGGVKTRSWHA